MSDASPVNDQDVAATLRDIREKARAAARAVPERRDEPAPAATPAPPAPPPPARRGLEARLRRLVRPVLMRVATWMSRAMLERLATLEGSLGHAIGEVRSVAAGHEQRLQQLEEEGVRLRQRVLQLDDARAAGSHDQRLHDLEEETVRLRQMVLQLDEAAQLADRSRRGALRRIEELEAELGRQAASAGRSGS